jgi:membrane protein DedA with SNARE-associated domain
MIGLAVMAGNPPPLPGFLQPVAGPLDHYGYGTIALLLFLENIGVPVVPGEFALIAGSIFAGTGRAGLNVVVVGVVAVVCCFCGAEIGYCIGRFGGRALILRYGKFVLVREHHLDRAEAAVTRYGGVIVVLARFVVGLREFNGIIAGATGMRWQRFAFYNAIGAVAWVGLWVSLGYLAGDHIAAIYSDATRYSLYVFIALVVFLAAYIAFRLVRRRRHRPSLAAQEGTHAHTNSH